jgi:hypothetical protein
MSMLRRWTGLALFALATAPAVSSAQLPAFDPSLWAGAVHVNTFDQCFTDPTSGFEASCHQLRTEHGIDGATDAPAFRAFLHDDYFTEVRAGGIIWEARPYSSMPRHVNGPGGVVGFTGAPQTLRTEGAFTPAEWAALFASPVFNRYDLEVMVCTSDPLDPFAGRSCGEWEVHLTNASYDVQFGTAPEPATVALTASGLLVLAGVARRRRA